MSDDYCITILTIDIETTVFRQLRDFKVRNEREYNHYKDELDHQDIDDCINRLSNYECENYIHKYGIHDAIKQYIDDFGNLPINDDVNICKTLLYCIVENHLEITYNDYLEWCERNPEEESEGEEGEGEESEGEESEGEERAEGQETTN
jgi:hypothetical protein